MGTRVEAALSLWKIEGRSEAVVPELVKALAEEDVELRRFVAEALASVGPDAKEAVPALRQLLASRPAGRRPTSLEREAFAATAAALRKIDADAAHEVLGEE